MYSSFLVMTCLPIGAYSYIPPKKELHRSLQVVSAEYNTFGLLQGLRWLGSKGRSTSSPAKEYPELPRVLA